MPRYTVTLKQVRYAVLEVIAASEVAAEKLALGEADVVEYGDTKTKVNSVWRGRE